MDINALRERAERCYRDGRLTEALDAYTSLCTQTPADAQVWHMQAAISGMLGQYQNAADCCEKAMALSPFTPAIYINYATALIELSRHDDALAALQKAIKLNPADTNILVMLGNLCLLMENHREAETFFRQALKLSPKNTDAASNLSRLLMDAGRVDESASVCERSLSCNPNNSNLLLTLIECHLVSGNTCKCRKTVAHAITCIDNITGHLYAVIRKMHTERKYSHLIPAIQMLIKVIPDEHRLYLILADCQIRTGNNTAAIETIEDCGQDPPAYDALILLAKAYENCNDGESAKACIIKASEMAPDEVTPVILLSRMHQKKGEPKNALQHLESFLAKHPDAHKAHIEAGDIHNRAGNFSRAEHHYRQAIEAWPEYAIAHNSLGMVYLNRKMEEAAYGCFKTAISHDPELLPAYCNLAHLHCTSGDYEQAETYYDKVLELDPEFESAISGKAAIYELQGNARKALELVEPFIHAQTGNINTLLVYARACHKIGKERNAIDILGHALDNPLVTDNDRMQLHFTIGRLQDRLGEYDKAFLYFERGNKMNKSPFDRDTHVRFIDTLISSFGVSNMGDIPNSTNRARGLVFIVGMPRSGTTLTEQILSSHPDVYGAGELSDIRDIAAGIPAAMDSKQSFPAGIAEITREVLDRFSYNHLQNLQSLASGSKVITDKMPSNFMFLGLIELLFPNARVLHCVRDPMDTCLSCYFQQFSRWQQFSYDLSDLALYYQQYRRLMKHWKSTLSIPIMDIHYESLVQNTDELTRQMLEFAELHWHPACAEFHKSGRKVITASYDQVRRPIYNSSIGRWKHYKKHLSKLYQELSEFHETTDQSLTT